MRHEGCTIASLMQGILYVALQTCVLTYVLVLVLSSKSYLSRSTPSIVASVWSTPASQIVRDSFESHLQSKCACQNDASSAHCTIYEFMLPDFGSFDEFRCAELPHSLSVKAETQEVFVSTALKVRVYLIALCLAGSFCLVFGLAEQGSVGAISVIDSFGAQHS